MSARFLLSISELAGGTFLPNVCRLFGQLRLSASIWILTRPIREAARLSRFNLIDKSGRLRLNLLQLVRFLAGHSLARRAVPNLELILKQNL